MSGAGQSAGRKRTPFYRADLPPANSVIPSRCTNALIETSSSQDPYAMAQKAVEVGHAILQGKTPAEKVTLIPTELVTRENVNQYKGWTSK
jgi:ribose transport system substrate-binding protein